MTGTIPEPILESDLPIIDPHLHLWNLQKRIVGFAPDDEKRELFANNAARFYGIEDLPGLA